MPAHKVVTLALKAMESNRSYLITGCGNWLLGQLHRFVTRRRLVLSLKNIAPALGLSKNGSVQRKGVALKSLIADR
jgi:hypothetical protein